MGYISLSSWEAHWTNCESVSPSLVQIKVTTGALKREKDHPKKGRFSRWWPKTIAFSLSLLTEFSLALHFASVLVIDVSVRKPRDTTRYWEQWVLERALEEPDLIWREQGTTFICTKAGEMDLQCFMFYSWSLTDFAVMKECSLNYLFEQCAFRYSNIFNMYVST